MDGLIDWLVCFTLTAKGAGSKSSEACSAIATGSSESIWIIILSISSWREHEANGNEHTHEAVHFFLKSSRSFSWARLWYCSHLYKEQFPWKIQPRKSDKFVNVEYWKKVRCDLKSLEHWRGTARNCATNVRLNDARVWLWCGISRVQRRHRHAWWPLRALALNFWQRKWYLSGHLFTRCCLFNFTVEPLISSSSRDPVSIHLRDTARWTCVFYSLARWTCVFVRFFTAGVCGLADRPVSTVILQLN